MGAPSDDALSNDAPGDYVTVAHSYDATEAHTLRQFLRSANIPAEAADTNMVQADWLMVVAMGGAAIRVPSEYAQAAREAIDAWRAGEWALPDDFDPSVDQGDVNP
jgi:hypothetical protein